MQGGREEGGGGGCMQLCLVCAGCSLHEQDEMEAGDAKANQLQHLPWCKWLHDAARGSLFNTTRPEKSGSGLQDAVG